MLGDRAQAPSGAGYAIENRLALSRAIPESTARRASNGSPRSFRPSRPSSPPSPATTSARLPADAGTVERNLLRARLSRAFSRAFLVEGEDLSVRDDGVFVRTVSGLQRTEVCGRIDADFADPLE